MKICSWLSSKIVVNYYKNIQLDQKRLAFSNGWFPRLWYSCDEQLFYYILLLWGLIVKIIYVWIVFLKKKIKLKIVQYN